MTYTDKIVFRMFKTLTDEQKYDLLEKLTLENKELKEQLSIYGVSNCNAKKDINIENTILLISRKDGLTDVYDNSGCLGKGLDTQGINDLNIT